MAINRRTVVIAIVGVLVLAVVALFVITVLGSTLAGQDTSCTTFGCVNALTIRFEGFLPKRYRIEVSTLFAATRRLDCPTPGAIGLDANSQCNPSGAVLYNYSPDEVTVKVTWEGGSKTETFNVAYETVQPSSSQCEPNCHVGTIIMTLP